MGGYGWKVSVKQHIIIITCYFLDVVFVVMHMMHNHADMKHLVGCMQMALSQEVYTPGQEITVSAHITANHVVST